MILSLGKKEYPTAEHMQRINHGEKMEKIWKNIFFDETDPFLDLKGYFSECPSKLKLLKNAVNPIRAICQQTTRFFIGGDMTAVASDEAIQKEVDEISKESKLIKKLAQVSNDFQNYGYATLLVYKKDDKIVTSPISYSSSFPIKDIDGNIKKWVVGKHLALEKNGGKIHYFNASEYKKEGDDVSFERKLYKIIDHRNLTLGDPVKFAELGEEYAYLDAPPAIENEIQIPIFEFKESSITDEDYAMGITEKCSPLLKSININLIKIDNELRKNMSALLALPANRVPVEMDASGNTFIDRNKVGTILMQEGDLHPKYITNDNPLIEECFKKIETDLKMMATIAEVPITFLIPESGGQAETATARKLAMSAFLKKIEDYQTIFNSVATDIYETALIMKGKDVPEDFSIKIQFREGVPKDRAEMAETYSTEIGAGITSQFKAIKEHHGLTDEETDKEMERIKGESGVSFNSELV